MTDFICITVFSLIYKTITLGFWKIPLSFLCCFTNLLFDAGFDIERVLFFFLLPALTECEHEGFYCP